MCGVKGWMGMSNRAYNLAIIVTVLLIILLGQALAIALYIATW